MRGAITPRRGTQCPSAKLDNDKVRAMRKRRAAGWTYPALAAEYGVHRTVARAACAGLTWLHVTDDREEADHDDARPGDRGTALAAVRATQAEAEEMKCKLRD